MRQMYLSRSDVVRHDLVSRIVDAYDKAEKQSPADGQADER